MPSRKYHRRTFSSALPEGSRVLVYCRYSGEQQDDRSQRMELERAIAANRWQLVEWFQDDARSGSSDQRPGWQALIARSREQPRPADGVVAWKGDRISRDQLDASYYKADLRRRGYVLHFLADELPDGPMQPLFESLLQWKAEQDLRDISANTIRGQQSVVRMELERDGKVVKGFSSGGFPPRGYRRSAPIRTGQRRNGDPRYNVVWEPDPALWPACRRAVDLLLAGETYERINAETGLFKQAAHLSTWFRSEALYGRRQHGEAVVEDAHERLITADEEPLVRAKLEERHAQQARVHPRRVASDWLLSGLIHCGYCRDAGRDAAMWGLETAKGRWYRCKHAHEPTANYRLVRSDAAERLVVDAVLRRLDIAVYRPLLASVQRAWEDRRATQFAALGRWRAEIEALERRTRELARALGDGYSVTLRRELADAEARLAQLRRQRLDTGTARPFADTDLAAFLADARESIEPDGDVGRRRRRLGVHVARVDAYAGKLVVHWVAPFAPGQVAYTPVPPAGGGANATILTLPGPGRGKKRAPFAAELAAARDAGETFTALGKRYGVSAQRAARVYERWRRERTG